MEDKRKEPTPGYRYSTDDLDSAVRALMEQFSKDKSKDARVANVRAAAAMLHRLGEASGDVVIKGCCTQDCCDKEVLKLIEGL